MGEHDILTEAKLFTADGSIELGSLGSISVTDISEDEIEEAQFENDLVRGYRLSDAESTFSCSIEDCHFSPYILLPLLPRYLYKEMAFPRKKRRGTMRRKRRWLREHPDWKTKEIKYYA
jgi:hypothetical protein